MIGICIGLSVILIAFLCIRSFPFQNHRLDHGTYDKYGLYLTVVTLGVIYFSNQYLTENQVLKAMVLILAIFLAGIAVAFVSKQLIYDYKHKKLPFQRK